MIQTIEGLIEAMAKLAAKQQEDGAGKGMCLLVFEDGSGVWCEANYARKWYREEWSKQDLLLHSKRYFRSAAQAARLMTEELAEFAEFNEAS